MSSTIANLSYLFKKLYSKERIHRLITGKSPFLAKIRKVPGFVGDGDFLHVVEDALPQGVSSTLTDAIAAVSSSKGIRWTVPRKTKYAVCKIAGDAIWASKKDEGAFVRIFERELNGTLQSMHRSFAVDVCGDGSGVIGQRSGALAGNVVTLVNGDDVRNFDRGMSVQANDSADAVTPRVGSTSVTGINYGTGKITLADATQIAAFAASDYLFRRGDMAAVLMGARGWIPTTDPTAAESYMGVDRSVNNEAYSGWRIAASVSTLEEACIDAGVAVSRMDRSLTEGFCGPTLWGSLVKRLGSKVMREEGGGAVIGFEYIEIQTQAGRIKLYADPRFSSTEVLLTDMDTWFMPYLGPDWCHIINDDGLDFRKVSGEDNFMSEWRSWCNLVNGAPGNTVRITVS